MPILFRQVRNCYLEGLNDLNHTVDWVREHVAGYLNDLITIGVTGFRVDAAKHMWPSDIGAMQVNREPTLLHG